MELPSGVNQENAALREKVARDCADRALAQWKETDMRGGKKGEKYGGGELNCQRWFQLDAGSQSANPQQQQQQEAAGRRKY